MESIHELLIRIHCDTDFGCSFFEIGYTDRKADNIIRVPFREVTQSTGNTYSFHVHDEDNIPQCVPMHLVKEVYKDGVLIWKK